MEHTSTPLKAPNTTILPSEKVKCNDDSFSALTIEECELHFMEQYENNIDSFAESKDKLSLLRSCIELLNRLEDTTYNSFAGRVLIFLARVIPLFDQSGVNLRSEFSVRELPTAVVDNLERLGAQNAERDKQISQLIAQDIEEGETLSDDESTEARTQEDSDRVYERFWKVQHFLSQPNLLYDKNSWFTFRTHVDTLLYNMESKPTSLKVWKLKDSYMTDSKSLNLQFNDINMRRCFMVQILIVLQYLELPVETKSENFVLDKVQLTWSSTVSKRIYNLLETIPNMEEGGKFLGLVRHILRREEMWNRWKNEKCREPIKPQEDEELLNMRSTYQKRRKISDELTSAKPYNMHVIGSLDMSKLWNMKPAQKFNTPDLAKYLHITKEKQAESFKDATFSFRLLRMLRKSPHFFGPSTAVINSMDIYLKAAASRSTHAEKKNSQDRSLELQDQETEVPSSISATNTTSSSDDHLMEST